MVTRRGPRLRPPALRDGLGPQHLRRKSEQKISRLRSLRPKSPGDGAVARAARAAELAAVPQQGDPCPCPWPTRATGQSWLQPELRAAALGGMLGSGRVGTVCAGRRVCCPGARVPCFSLGNRSAKPLTPASWAALAAFSDRPGSAKACRSWQPRASLAQTRVTECTLCTRKEKRSCRAFSAKAGRAP